MEMQASENASGPASKQASGVGTDATAKFTDGQVDGTSKNSPNQSESVHLVIIGAGASGAKLAKLFYEHPEYSISVTLIAKAPCHLHTPAAVRLCVQPELYDKYVLNLKDVYEKEKPASIKSDPTIPRVRVVEGQVIDIDFDSKTIYYNPPATTTATKTPVEPPAEPSAETNTEVKLESCLKFSDEKNELKYDYLVLASGSKQCSPLWGFIGRERETRNSMEDLAKQLAAAKRVAIIGAGATGTEVAAEIVETFPALKNNVNLYTGKNPPMFEFFGASRSKVIVNKLTRLGVNVIQEEAEFEKQGAKYKRKIAPKTDMSEEAAAPSATSTAGETTHTPSGDDSDVLFDVVVPTIGAKLSSDYLKNQTPSLLDPEDGSVVTDEYLRVRPGVYAMGDIIKGSPRSWPDAGAMAGIVFTTVLVDLKLMPACKLTKFKVGKKTKIVTLGRKDGVGIIAGYPVLAILISWMKGGDFLVNNFKNVKP